ncbi:MAG: hypothetical protein SFU27_01350 [Thermonemataceae bacterium]|nr:hypothetical protein [Thermonemataceae bacterium]
MRELYNILIGLFVSVWAITVSAQDSSGKEITLAQTLKKIEFEPSMMLQLWVSHTDSQDIYDTDAKIYQKVENRLNVQFRRARFGFQAKPVKNVSITFVGYYDLIGRDALAATFGGLNTENNFGVWDAFGQWKISKKTELLYLTAGLFRPQINRESMTSAFAVNSMEKAMTQNYTRPHFTSNSSGRTLGLNLGGLWLNKKQNFGLQYNVGIFPNNYNTLKNASLGRQAAPLGVGRVAFQIGQSEQDVYKIAYQTNYFNNRKGISVAIGGAGQGATELFDASYLSSIDILLNWKGLNFNAEWNRMWREKGNNTTYQVLTQTASHLRLGYNIKWKNTWIEPTIMGAFYIGENAIEQQSLAKTIGMSSGSHQNYDIGLNWYINENKMKILLHYTINQGQAGELLEGCVPNMYFTQSGVGAIRRGNWLGFGANMIF